MTNPDSKRSLSVRKTAYFIEGDGIGPEVWQATRPVLDKALDKAYSGQHSLEWVELLAGEKAYKETGEYLPARTLDTLREAELAIKGPLATPVGGGFRSLNVTLRQVLDLYACIRPVRYFQGIMSPLKRPELVDMVVFRENTEDVYAGIEWAAGSPEAEKVASFLRDEMKADIAPGSGIGIKPISEKGSKRLVRKAIDYALYKKRPSVTLVHKGNIMKYTEGAFRAWGYELAREEYADRTITEDEAGQGKTGLVIKDRIADAMFQQVLLKPELYSVIATTNLNGDYLSDALAAQVGGLGLAPGVNMSDRLAFFEATHGTVPSYAGKDVVNPGSLILSGAMLLEHAGWEKASDLIHASIEKVVSSKRVTQDLARQIPDAVTVGCKEFGELIGENL
ncbi:NADP-dependent isocitrate dehydrogenase [Desulfonatronospira sp. MSAO_Bac3]|uniref:NADP-dependent isocitrate dehydrogenase n=1 Tax=Desulfonatronospira sp. MSAO_Bac3 TaxID=2293857 RepID=UPI000FF6779E|nr:NADP-dependent isocitrate dehydrogenase [Desulfonatronospira sp. MSAO_Bac3]RQD78692.1 MAG: NADP-dependent isocitrate dehydrogenase [Desulfonatronospira sp. MSAO_Bac3]